MRAFARICDDGARVENERNPRENSLTNRRTRARLSDTMAEAYDEVDLDDMEWDEDLAAYTYQCPCGDVFRITEEELRDGEEIARCPSCSLVLRVVYEREDVQERGRERA